MIGNTISEAVKTEPATSSKWNKQLLICCVLGPNYHKHRLHLKITEPPDEILLMAFENDLSKEDFQSARASMKCLWPRHGSHSLPHT